MLVPEQSSSSDVNQKVAKIMPAFVAEVMCKAELLETTKTCWVM